MHDIEKFSLSLRLLILEIIYKSKSSHIASCFSIADILAVLYGHLLDTNLIRKNDPNRDRVVLSKGHSAAAMYSALSISGIIDKTDLDNYGNDGSDFMTHISHKIKGVEFSTGSLGHGLPFSVGKALYAKRNGLNWKCYTILSDGELDEGSNWEAIMLASHHKLDNLVIIIDYNKYQSLTTVEQTLNLEPLEDKFISFGAAVTIVDGHSHNELINGFNGKKSSTKPYVLICNTIKGKGVSFMENKVMWHYKNPSREEYLQAHKELSNQYA